MLQEHHLRIATRAVLICTALVALQACAPTHHASSEVAQAYESSGMVAMKPYTRSIFNTHNF